MLYCSRINKKNVVDLMGYSDLKMMMKVYAYSDETICYRNAIIFLMFYSYFEPIIKPENPCKIKIFGLLTHMSHWGLEPQTT